MTEEKFDNLCGEVACAIKEAYEQGAVDQKLNDIGFEDGLEEYSWERARAILEPLPRHDGWIKIEDALPEKHTEVLVYEKGITGTAWINSDGNWVDAHPTHWQPLPSPPR